MPSVSVNTKSSATVGTLIAIVVGWFVTTVLKVPMDDGVAFAAGSLVGTFVGWVAEIVQHKFGVTNATPS